MNAEEPGELLRGCTFVAVPFAGGLCEVPHFTANVINVNDLDRHVMNLCSVVRDRRADLVTWLDGTPYHEDQLRESQKVCREIEDAVPIMENFDPYNVIDSFEWACHYFIASWMTRGGKGGTKGEFDAGLSIRWKSGGGDSVVRFRSATEALAEWEKVMRRCTFTTMDAFDFLTECRKRDIPENGIYCDPPWVDDGDGYKCGGFDELVNWSDGMNWLDGMERITKHAAMARMLAGFQQTRIVVRYGDCPTVRELYPESLWTWHRLESRTQANKVKAEVLLEKKGAA